MATIIAGMDIGFGQVKVCLQDGEAKLRHLCFPRIFAEAKTGSWGLNTHTIYGIEGDRFYVGEEALSYQESFIRRDYRDYVRDKTYWICVAKALKELGLLDGEHTVRLNRLIMGLAPGHYSKENIGYMRWRALRGVEVAVNNTLYRFSAENVKVLPQGSGAFFAKTLTESGFIKEKDSYKKPYGILDVGYRTTDFLMFENGQFINQTDELSEDTGMRTVLEKLQSHVKREYDKEELEFLTPLLKGQPFEFRGAAHNLNPVVNRLATDHIRKRIEPEILKRWEGRLNRMHKIIICGGGAHFFRNMTDFLETHQKQILIPDDPEMFNATGFYRYGVMQDTLGIVKAK